MTPREYARHRGCTQQAVDAALRKGRLPHARKDERGRWQIDAATADREWAANTQADRVPLTGPGAKRGGPVVAPPTLEAPAQEDGTEPPAYAVSRAKREAAEAALAELELAKEEARLVPAADVEARIADDYGKVRTKLLGVPSRVRQRDPTLTAAQLALLEAAIREALTDLSDGRDVAA